MDPRSPLKIGRFSKGVEAAIASTAPEKMPPDPIPATARPSISPKDLGVAPQTSEPSSKMARETRNTHFVGNRL